MGIVSTRKQLGSAPIPHTIEGEGADLRNANAPAFHAPRVGRTQRVHKCQPPIAGGAGRNQTEKVAVLQQFGLFRGLLSAECEEIASRATEAHFDQGQIVFREDDPVTSVSVVVSGRVKVTQRSRSGAEVILRVRSKGEVLGGIGMMPGAFQFVTAQILEPCVLMMWDSRVFEQFEERFPALRRNIVRIFAERLRSLEQQFLEIANEQVAPRLARALVRLAEQNAGEARNATRIELSREELAQMTGTTAFTVGRLLSAWEERGILQIQRKSITIHDLSALISVAQAPERAQ